MFWDVDSIFFQLGEDGSGRTVDATGELVFDTSLAGLLVTVETEAGFPEFTAPTALIGFGVFFSCCGCTRNDLRASSRTWFARSG